ncbi:uncharacterized protein METZ01_LOCUS381212, partial [marine metagenome]
MSNYEDKPIKSIKSEKLDLALTKVKRLTNH